MIGANVTSVKATAVALRGLSSISAISPKMPSGLEGLEMTVAAYDLHLSTHDNEELVATIALPEDRLAFGEIARRKPGAQEMMETDFRFWHFAIPMRRRHAHCSPPCKIGPSDNPDKYFGAAA